MRFIGVDMASQPTNTGLVVLHADTGEPHLTVAEARGNASDADILAVIESSSDPVVAIDAPLGWPLRFREQMRSWTIQEWTDEMRNQLIYRATDRYVSTDRKVGNPLSVSANLIAIPAMRTRALLTRLGVSSLDGTDGVYETYPAASLRVWGLTGIPYKGRHATAEGRRELFRELMKRWDLRAADEEHLTVNDHVLDALICALTVYEVLQQGTRIPDEHVTAAREEGWIHVPRV